MNQVGGNQILENSVQVSSRNLGPVGQIISRGGLADLVSQAGYRAEGVFGGFGKHQALPSERAKPYSTP